MSSRRLPVFEKAQAESAMKTFWRRAAAIAVLMTLAALTDACSNGEDEQEHGADRDEALSLGERVEIEALRYADSRTLLTRPAEVRSSPQAAWNLSPPTRLRLESWQVEVGSVVGIGDSLATVSSIEVGDLDAALNGARRELRARQELVSELESARRAGVMSAAEVAAARADEAQARGRVQELGSLIRARQSGDDGQWRSPVGGTISSLDCAPGEIVSPDEHCLRIVDATAVEVVAYLPQRYLPELHPNLEAIFEAEGNAASAVALRLRRHAPELDEATRSLPLYFASTHEEQLLRPGMAGRVSLLASLDEPAFVVPSSALTLLEGREHIYVRSGESDSPDDFDALAVQVLDRREGRAVIRGEGLHEGLAVVTRGTFLLKSIEVMSGAQGGHH